MFEIKHHNFRYRPKVNMNDSFTSNFEEKRIIFSQKSKKIFPYSVSGPANSMKKSKVQLEPLLLDNQQKQKPTILESVKAQSAINKAFQDQKTRYPRMTGQIFFRTKKNAQVVFKSTKPNDSYFSTRGKIDQISCFVQSVKGKRSYNEDRYICKEKCGSLRDQVFRSQKSKNQYDLYGVFDGHGGSQCSQFIKNNIYQLLSSSKSILFDPQIALKQSFAKLQQKFISICEKKGNLEMSGSCAIVALVYGDKLYVSNVGDSRALLLSSQEVVQLSKDHKPQNKEEKLRIIQHGGKLIKEETIKRNNIRVFHQTRIMPGSLNVSRTIGDIEIKLRKYGGSPGIVVADPDITVHEINPTQHLLLASDGLFQGLTNQQIHNIYLKVKEQHGMADSEVLTKLIGQQLIKEAEQTSSDNITVIVVKIN